ncbi:putative membrane protein [Leadbettera azotonutricia ZAS-9]|uniref:Putative membrane protein n=2 Tax=Leadbettera azotonutricia TaxID=150829 RepID=F5Y6N5_LEAAZ|nr:putative membrane protein [Leadbettera azotonutricia ZAS-9]
MAEKRNWFSKPVSALCISIGALVASLFLIFNAQGGFNGTEDVSYMVTLRDYGVEAREMERKAAIPLEDALSSISGINKVITLSENSRVRAYAVFRRDKTNKHAYDAVREAAQRVYEIMPSSSQRPEIGSSNDSFIPVWIAAISGSPDGDYLEKVLKPALNSIEGVGEVEVSGSGIAEIIIIPDLKKIAALGLSPSAIASVLASNDGLYMGGRIQSGSREIPVIMDGRYPDLASLGNALIPISSGAAIKLKDIADLREEEREGEVLSRLDGKKTAVISIIPSSDANLGRLSRAIKVELAKFKNKFKNDYFEMNILSDRGAEEGSAFCSALIAALEASILVALASILLTRNKGSRSSGFVCAAAIPIVWIISAAMLSLFGFVPDRKLLAGLSVGIGTAADAAILCAEGFGNCRNAREGRKILSRLAPALVSGAATTIAALFPLAKFKLAEDISIIVLALGTVTMVSLIAALTVLPPLFLWDKKDDLSYSRTKSFPIINRIQRKGVRFFAFMIKSCIKNPLIFVLVALFITIMGIIVLIFSGADISASESRDSVYARVEFEGGFSKEEADKLLAFWVLDIKSNEGIKSVQTSARTGSSQILVNFDPLKIKSAEVRELLRSIKVPGGFLYIPETSMNERIWEITVSGDDDFRCRELAKKAASLCVPLPLVQETILNFKEGSPRLSLLPFRDKLAEEGLSFSGLADSVRRGVHGPVIYKRSGEKGEIDVRLKLSKEMTADDINHLPLAIRNQGYSWVQSLTSEYRDHELSLIRREDRRRTASFSIRTQPMDPRVVRDNVMEIIKGIELPPGYALEFDREAIKKAEILSGTGFLFILALFFCYIVIAAANESFSLPFLVLSVVPPSLAIPVSILSIVNISINASVACSLVAVSGMAVNASVLIAGEFRQFFVDKRFINQREFYNSLRNRLPCLLATTGTTLAGAIPFIFLRDGSNSFIRILSVVTLLGVGSSFIFALILVPSLICIFLNPKHTGKELLLGV